MRNKSLFFNIFSGFLLLVVLLSGSMLFLIFSEIHDSYYNLLENDLKNLAFTMKLTITPLVESGAVGQLESTIRELDPKIHARITFINPNGLVLADSEKDASTMENHKNRPEVAQAFKLVTGFSVRYSMTVKEKMLYVALPVESNGNFLGVLRLSLFVKDIDTLVSNLQTSILKVTAVVIAVALILAGLFARNIHKHAKSLRDATAKVASGDFSAKVYMDDIVEFSVVAESFNHMTGKVNELFKEISKQKEELNTVVSSVQEGLIVIDSFDRIVFLNRAFETISGLPLEKGRFFWEVFRNAELNSLIEKTKKDRTNLSSEIEINGKTCLLSLTYMGSNDEIICVLHDISSIKNLETLKKNLIANVSHELRTPLTSIKGFAETVEAGLGESEEKHYVEIIRKNANRLINIVNDLLTLSALEDKGFALNLEKVNMKELITDSTKLFEKQIKEKKLTLTIELPREIIIKADPFRLEQVFTNLIDNAVKYTEKGSIAISCLKENDIVTIVLKDSGPGIPNDYLERIFDRFFVVDTSRSKKLGGTGLGLSIVKHIILLHNGTISVSSVVGQGSSFTITLPA
jgi:two-component system phosphate regulon sensor histidine kinase PhoR